VRNLVAHPETTIHVPRRGRIAVRARVVDAAERAELWPRLLDLYADFATYEQWTDRVIPVIVLDRNDPTTQGARP
jgi:deazaflavin-dependent oxidoreductase (nitroreductase family)